MFWDFGQLTTTGIVAPVVEILIGPIPYPNGLAKNERKADQLVTKIGCQGRRKEVTDFDEMELWGFAVEA
jgi:hypothetical protein